MIDITKPLTNERALRIIAVAKDFFDAEAEARTIVSYAHDAVTRHNDELTPEARATAQEVLRIYEEKDDAHAR